MTDPFQEHDSYEEADKAAVRAGVGDVAWKVITEIGRATKTPDHACPTKNEIAEAMSRVHGHYSDISYHLRKAIKSGLVAKVGVSLHGGGNTYGLTIAGSRLVGFKCETYTDDGPDTLNLVRTKMVLEQFDKLNDEYDAKVSGMSNTEALRFLDRIEEAAKAVGEAFALDTEDRNPHDAAVLVRPGPWLRRLIKKYGGE